MSVPSTQTAFPIAAFLATGTLGSMQHSVLHGNEGAAIQLLEQWAMPALNAKVLGVVADDTTATSVAAGAQFVMQVGVNAGVNVYFPGGKFRCDNGTTGTPIVVSYAAAVGESRILGDGDGSTQFTCHVTLDSATACLVDFTNTNPLQSPNCAGFSVQGPGSFVNPNETTKTANTSGVTAVMVGSGFNANVGAIVTGTGIAADTYIRFVNGTNVTLSRNLTGAGGASTTITIGIGHANVGRGYRVASCTHTSGVYAGGWYAGFYTSSQGSSAIATDHTIVDDWCSVQENVIGWLFEDTVTGGTLDYYIEKFRNSRNQLAGFGCGNNGYIGSSHMTDVHLNAQPYGFIKLGTGGIAPHTIGGTDLFIDGLVMTRVKFEGSGNRAFHDQTGLCTIRGLMGYIENHGVETNGQKNKTSGPTYASNDHTRRPVVITSMTRSGAGLVTATTSTAINVDNVGKVAAVAGAIVTGTGDVANGSASITGVSGSFTVGQRIYGAGIPDDSIVGAFSGGTITLKNFAGTNAPATSTHAGTALVASAYNFDARIKSVSGTTVTWDTGILQSFGAEAGSMGMVGFMYCGLLSASDFQVDFSNDPSTYHTYPERRMDLLSAQDVVIRPTQPDKAPINFPEVQIRDSGYDAVSGNFVCKQGEISAWLGKCNTTITAGQCLTLRSKGVVDIHPGTTTVPYAGIALQDGSQAAVTQIASPSGGAAGSSGTITVASTTDFPSTGTIRLPLTGGAGVPVAYTGKTSTTFTGCTGGSGTIDANGSNVLLVTSSNLNFVWVQTAGPVDTTAAGSSGRGPGVQCTSSVAANKWLALDTGGKVIEYASSTKLIIGSSMHADSGGYVQSKLCSVFQMS